MKQTFSKHFAVLTLAAAATFAASAAWAAQKGDHATADEAVAMVKKGVQFIKANGREKAYAEFTSKNSKFKDRDLYLVVYGMDGKVWAHGQNERMVGKVVIDLKDIDGKEFVRERVELAKSKPNFWQDYKFTNPLTKKIEPKRMYCERLDDTVVCGGIYK
jgi:signal transduction histidine kinase